MKNSHSFPGPEGQPWDFAGSRWSITSGESVKQIYFSRFPREHVVWAAVCSRKQNPFEPPGALAIVKGRLIESSSSPRESTQWPTPTCLRQLLALQTSNKRNIHRLFISGSPAPWLYFRRNERCCGLSAVKPF